MTDLNYVAEALDRAAADAQAIPQLSTHGTALTLEEAYDVQRRSIALREQRGEKIVGVKMGFTSKAKMEQMGVDDLIWGLLTDSMHIKNGDGIQFPDYVHPRAEPEIAFLLDTPLSGPITEAQAKAAVKSIAPAIEIIDSRYANFKFSLEDVVADNCSSTGFVIGDWQDPSIDISDLGIALFVNDTPVENGSSKAILGNPWLSLMDASRLAGAAGLTLGAGHVVLAGAATAAYAVSPGDKISADIEQLGPVEFYVEGEDTPHD